MSQPKSPRVLLYFYATAGLAAVGQGLVLSYLLVYLHIGWHIKLRTAGSILAAAGVTGIVASAGAGALIDRIGPLRAFKFGIAMQSVGAVAVASITGPRSAFFAVALAGIGPALFWPAQVGLLSALADATKTTKAFAIQFSVLNAGIGIGGLISGSFIQLHSPASYIRIYFADAFMLAFALVILSIGFSRSREDVSRLLTRTKDVVVGGRSRRLTRLSYRAVFADLAFRRYLFVHFGVVFFAFAQLDTGWSAFAIQYCGATPRVVGLAFAVNTAIIAFAQLPIAKFMDRMARSHALSLAGFLWTFSWLLCAIAAWPRIHGTYSDVFLVSSMGVFGLAETVFSPVSSMLINELATTELRGRYNAVTSSMWSLASLIAPSLSAILLSFQISLLWVTPLIIGSFVTALFAKRLSKTLPNKVEAPRGRFGLPQE